MSEKPCLGERMPGECVFCKIASKKIPASIVFENGHFIAFLDINPAAKGHSLVVPKKHASGLLELGEPEISEFARAIQKVARAVMKTTKSHGFNVVLNEGKSAGQVIFHVHAHVVPRFEGDPVNFRVPREKYAEGEAAAIAKKILEASQAK